MSRRAGIVAAALVATSPFLVWYSQEARSYALFALLGATSVLAFGLALRGDRRWLAGWCVVCALTLATHYFGVFLVGAEAVWLLARLRPRLPVVLASLVPVATLLAHLPVLLDQRGNGEAVAGSSLASRIAGIPKNLVVGYSFPLEAAGSVARCLPRRSSVSSSLARLTPARATGSACRRLARGRGRARPDRARSRRAGLRHRAERDRRRRPCGGLRRGGARVEAAGGCGRRAAVRSLRRDRPRPGARRDATAAPTGAALPRRSAPTDVPRAIVVTPYMSRSLWRPYLPGLGRARTATSAVVQEIAVVGLATEGGYSAGHLEPPDVGTPKPVPGFRVAAVERRPTFTLVRYVAERPTSVPIETLAGLALTDEQPGILLQGP